MFTIREKLGKLEGLTVAIVGDITHSRVARSNIYGLTTMGAKVRVCGPPTMMPPGIESLGAQVYYDMDKAIEGADVVMMLRLQLERQTAGLFPGVREYAGFYGLNQSRVDRAAKHVLVMHPGPMNRGVEISSEVADGMSGDPRPGNERRGGADGGDVPLVGRRKDGGLKRQLFSGEIGERRGYAVKNTWFELNLHFSVTSCRFPLREILNRVLIMNILIKNGHMHRSREQG